MVSPVTSISGLVSPTSTVGAIREPSASAVGQAAAGDFGSVLANLSSDAVSTLKAGEATAISGIQGQASVQEVVQTIMAAEQTLQAAIAIRDKVVSAYQEISRMQI
ncbi:flagellar hook-basal body complex protein FliE [Afifella pfennigii]|uniref:flagellar hook-basal body complex protein FliE n=1 Tax=Afifella pfennigii TaxID=209897 RepID=UPI00047CF541|nr:flagellar hook-basal body complex protein FliE [Afifella pfennigii]